MSAETHVGEPLNQRLAGIKRLSLFLDYDGTLADFAPTPKEAKPDPALIDVIARLSSGSGRRVAIVSGRPLRHLQTLLPVPGVLLAGTYGIEIQMRGGKIIYRADYDALRPTLEALKPQWARLVDGNEGVFLEDKGWALAIHARFAAPNTAERLISQARSAAASTVSPGPVFQVISDDQFLEVCPAVAHKGLTVRYLMEHDPWPGAVPVYAGDDGRDEEAFEVVHSLGGIGVRVACAPATTAADYLLDSPSAVREWLEALAR